MSIPNGMLSLKAIRLGVTDGFEIFLCPDSTSFFSGNLSISGVLTASSVVSGGDGIADLCFPIGTPTNYNDISLGSRPIDLSRNSFTTNIGLNLVPATLGCDAFQVIDQYFYTYWLSPPPPPTNINCSPAATVLTITWTNVPTIEAAFRDIELPHIIEIRIDYIPSANNGAGHDQWGGSTITINTGSKYTDTLELYTVGSGSNLNGNTWEEYTISPSTLYDFRIYGVNNHSGQLNYIQINDCSTSSIGIPIVPTSFTSTFAGLENITLDWTKPIDHDDTTVGNQVTPVIQQYKVNFIATAATQRYNGIYNTSHTGSSSTAITVDPTNSSSLLDITGLYPGTSYDFTVSAKNTLNNTGGSGLDGFGPTAAHSDDTIIPTVPALLSIGDASSLNNENSLISPYSNSGGYTLDGTTLLDPIINFNNINDVSLPIRTIDTPLIRHNNTPGSSAASITTLKAYAGLSSDYTDSGNTASGVFDGFGNNIAATLQTYTNGKSSLKASSEADHYTGSSSGFWQHLKMYSQGFDSATNFTASLNQYSIGVRYESTQGAGPVSTNAVTFWIDDINIVPSLSNVGVKNELNGGWERVSGIPSYNNTAEFLIQYEITDIANKFIRFDKKHVEMRMQSTGGTIYSSTTSILQSNIDASHKYYTSTGTDVTSTSLHNTSGLVLAEDPGIIQLNEFTLSLNSNANNKFDDNFVVRVVPFNLYGTGSSSTAGYRSSAISPVVLQLRIDTKSIENLVSINSTANKGTQVLSGAGNFPELGVTEANAGGVYDHDVSLIDSFYDEELQLVNGTYQSPSVGDGYINYSSGYFFSGSPSIPDYSSIVSNTNYRYTTFKLSGIDAGIPSGQTRERLRITINSMTGLTINTSTPNQENHRMYIRVVDIGDGNDIDNDTTTVGWMSLTNVITGVGILTGTNGTPCLNQSTSTNSQRDAFIRPGTTSSAVIYIRIGIPNNLNAKFNSINIVAQSGTF
jgi:hypothetical protein